MERRPPGWWRAPLDSGSGPWLLGLLLFPWTLQLAGRAAFLLPRSLARTSEWLSSARAANSWGPISGGLLAAFEHCRLHRGSLQGPGRCLANASAKVAFEGVGTALPSVSLLC